MPDLLRRAVAWLLPAFEICARQFSTDIPPFQLLEEVFELNESLDELREAKSSAGDISALKQKLESAQRNFQSKLEEVESTIAQLRKAQKSTPLP